MSGTVVTLQYQSMNVCGFYHTAGKHVNEAELAVVLPVSVEIRYCGSPNLYPRVPSRHRPGKQRPIWVVLPGYFFVILGRLSGHEGDGTEICDDRRDVAPIPLVPVPI